MITVATHFHNYLSTLFDTVAARLATCKDWPDFNGEPGRHISLAVLELDAF